jgi:hypothetical protein
MLPPEVGVAWIRREITSGTAAGEVVVATSLGMFGEHPSPTGGLDLAALTTEGSGPMVGEIVKASVLDGLTVRTTLDPTEQGFLDDHRYDGPAMFPGVMYMEAFAEVSKLLLPDWHVVAVEDVAYTGLKFFRDEPRTLTITSLLRPDPDDPQGLVAECTLSAERKLPGSDTPQVTTHGRGLVRLSADAPDPEKLAKPTLSSKKSISPDDVYAVYFHGPAYQVMQSVWRASKGKGAVSRFAEDIPANHSPSDAPTVIGPRLAEICFQTAGMWEMGTQGVLALPEKVGSLRVYGVPTEETPLVCTARPTDHGFDCVVQRKDGTVVVHMTGYRTVATPNPLPEEQAETFRRVMGD